MKFKKGQTPWNKGLTKETDERVKNYSEKRSTSMKGKIPHNKGKTLEQLYGKEKAKKMKENLRLKNIGKIHSEKTREKMKNSQKYVNHDNWSGKVMSKESNYKRRLSAIKYIESTRGPMKCNIGKYEKQILDEVEKFIQYPIKRQYHVKGYFVDGYLEKGNIVFEIDEKPKINKRDIRREIEIKQELNCTFIRIPTY